MSGETVGPNGTGVMCSACTTVTRCQLFGCAIVSGMANQPTRAEWWQQGDTLVRLTAQERQNVEWQKGGHCGADCKGGPLDGQVVLAVFAERNAAVGSMAGIGVDGHSDGAYWWTESETRSGRWIGEYRVCYLEWGAA